MQGIAALRGLGKALRHSDVDAMVSRAGGEGAAGFGAVHEDARRVGGRPGSGRVDWRPLARYAIIPPDRGRFDPVSYEDGREKGDRF